MKFVMAKFVLQLLLPEQKEHHTAGANDLIQITTNEPDFLKKIIARDELWVPMIQKQRPSHPDGSHLVLQAQRRHSKVATRSRLCQLCFLIWNVLSIPSIPLQAKQLIRSTTLVFHQLRDAI